MPNFRPLAIALGISLATLVPTHDAFAAAKKKAARAPAVSAQCSDFYDATNAGWLKANPVPQTGATTALGQLVDRSRQQQRDLLDAAMKSPQGNVQKLLGDFWASGLDEAAVEADGSNPIAPLLTRINAIKKAKDVPASIAALHQVGIPVAFNFGPDVDLKALDRHIGYFMQGGMGLPDPAFYTRTDADTVALMGRYRNYVKQILALTGTPAAKLDAESQAVIALETELARNAQSLAGINNPFNNYAPISTKELNSRYRNLQLDAFLKAQGVDDDLVSLADPGLFKQLDGMVTKLCRTSGRLRAGAWAIRWRRTCPRPTATPSSNSVAACCAAKPCHRSAGKACSMRSTWPPARWSAANMPRATCPPKIVARRRGSSTSCAKCRSKRSRTTAG